MHLEVGQKIELDYLIPEYNEEVTLERSGVAFDKKFFKLKKDHLLKVIIS